MNQDKYYPLTDAMVQARTIQRVFDWNEARYPMVHDVRLTRALLNEEALELASAYGNPVEILDAIGDLAFVAIGALWKAGYSVDNVTAYLSKPSAVLQPLSNIPTMVASDMVGLISQLYLWLKSAGIYLEEVLQIICTSNESKTIAKTNPSVKANLDKGPGFIAPTEGLTNLAKAAGLL